MTLQPLRQINLPEADRRTAEAWLGDLEARLAEPAADWNRIARDTLLQIWYPDVTDYDERIADPKLPAP